jgi:hypothetical protein
MTEKKKKKAAKRIALHAIDLDYKSVLNGKDQVEIKMVNGKAIITCPDEECNMEIAMSTNGASVKVFNFERHLHTHHKTDTEIEAEIKMAEQKEKEEMAKKQKKKSAENKGKEN